MIVWCTAIPLDEMEERLRNHERKGRAMVEGYGYVACIGIEPELSPLHSYSYTPSLILRMPDTVAMQDMPPHWTQSLKQQKAPLKVPTADDAAQIAQFVRSLHQDHRPWALLVHCTAGISRSPAVATWVREQCRISTPLPHSRWSPNPTLLRLLRVHHLR